MNIARNIVENKGILLKSGFDLINKKTDFDTKEKILMKMIEIYPDEPVLYFQMALIFRPISIERALVWHKICFGIQPDYFDNFIMMFETYFTMGLYEHMQQLNKNDLFEKFIKNTKFLSMHVRSRFSLCRYENCIKYMLYLIQSNSQKKCVTMEEKLEKYNNYHDAGYMFSHMGDNETAYKHIIKALDLAIKFDLPLVQKLLSFQTYLYLQDFFFEDEKEKNVFDKFLEINTYLPDSPMFSHVTENRKNKKIRLGYLSSDYNPHSVANFILPIFKHHDKSKFDVILLSNSANISNCFKETGLPIYEIHAMDNKTAAKFIYDLKIDILFDLNGNTANNRLGVFIYHPAPIQISYLGYANTTGLKSIQYRLSDFVADHPESTQKYSEQLIRMPGCFLLYNPLHNFIVEPKKVDEKKIVLGCLHKESKINARVFALWKKIMDECPNTVLFIKIESFDNLVERTEYYIKKTNVDKNRLIISSQLFDNKYETVYTNIDLMLDTFPYSGTTITCNSLYNSVPIVTLYNTNCHAHNVSSSLLINSGLSELVAYSEKEYMDMVIDFVKNPDKLRHYKKTVRAKFMELMNPKKFMSKYEYVLEKIFKNDIAEFIPKMPVQQPRIEEDNITIDFSKDAEEVVVEKKVYICGTVRNCGIYLEKVFSNISKIITLFDDYEVVISYDNIADNTVEVLKKLQSKYKLKIIHVLENEDIFHRELRSQRISNARNACLKYIRKSNKKDFNYYIVMDMDDVGSTPLNIDVLSYYMKNDADWDGLSFNTKPYYYDIWALSIDPYVVSCWHVPNGQDIVHVIADYMKKKLQTLKEYELLECYSAFNGFAIYKLEKFIDCNYNWRIKNITEYITPEQIRRQEQALGRPFTMDVSYQQFIHPATDCEHRQFHMEAAKKNGAKIRISKKEIFAEFLPM